MEALVLAGTSTAASGLGGSTRVVPNGFLSLLVFCKSRAPISLGTAALFSAVPETFSLSLD